MYRPRIQFVAQGKILVLRLSFCLAIILRAVWQLLRRHVLTQILKIARHIMFYMPWSLLLSRTPLSHGMPRMSAPLLEVYFFPSLARTDATKCPWAEKQQKQAQLFARPHSCIVSRPRVSYMRPQSEKRRGRSTGTRTCKGKTRKIRRCENQRSSNRHMDRSAP